MNEPFNGNSQDNVNFSMNENNGETVDTSNTNNVGETPSKQPDTTYHRSYINDSDPNAKTYVNPQSTGSGAPFYATYTTGEANNTSANADNAQYRSGQNDAYHNPFKEQGAYGNSYQTQQPYGNQTVNNADKPKKARVKKDHKVWKYIGKAAAFGIIAGGLMVGCLATYNHFSGSSKSTETHATTTTGGTVKTTSATSASTSSSGVSSIVDECMPSIVSITSTFEASTSSDFSNFYYWFYGGNSSSSKELTGSGSGVIISETDNQLMIVTNNHVISDSKYGDATKVQVTFSDDEIVDAVVKGADSDSDLAVLTVNKSDMKSDTLNTIKIAVIGDSSAMKVGDDVVAIGNALGYGQSVTRGIVSALNREVSLDDETTTKTMTLLQTDAAINPGNSGGALLNMNGELIGINSVKYASDDVEGMGYAIPMETAQPIVEELMNEEAVAEGEEAYLGIYGTDVESDLTTTYNMPEGVYVSNVIEDSPAAKAGIQQRDIVTKFNDHTISTMSGLQEQIAKKSAGTEVTLTIQRQGTDGSYEEKEIKVTLGNKSDAPSTTQSSSSSNDDSQSNSNSNGNGNDDYSNGYGNGYGDSSDPFSYFFGN